MLNAARAEESQALRRLASLQRKAGCSSAADRPRWSLHHAQLVIAHELGFTSWAKLKAHIEAENAALKGALVGAANRALEAERDEPLFVDPLARALAGKKGFALHKELRSTTWPPHAAGPAPEQSILTRYFDDALQSAARDLSLTQVVLLGAGMDARAFRLRWPAKLALFEVDDAAVFDLKEPVLRRRRAKPTCDRRIVRANLANDWTSKLLTAGFDARRPAAFLIPWLAHFDAATVERVFRELGEVACSGSWLGTNFVGLDTIESPFMKPLLDRFAALGYPAW
ncbi:MAG TPA: SAM-dependent methyltransferase, partial [Rhodanobacteraceae bacterium]|nr:SAM-dependent methyltransferase [Rhodanobacteraceae bacterium]